MFERFKRNGGNTDADRGRVATTQRPATTRHAGDVTTADRPAPMREGDEATTTHRGRFDRDDGTTAGVLDRETVRDVRARQREEYGGINWGAAFFGFLVAVGMAAILLGLLSAAGAAFGFTDMSQSSANANADTIGLVGGILLIAVVVVAYWCAGYVSGRMSRFDGGRQGLGSWAIGLIVTIALGVAGWFFGPDWNVFDKLGLPNVPIDNGTLTVGAAVAGVAVLLLSLLAAMGGGKAGERYHRKIDRFAVAG
jgi:fumarate reductase subunit D